MSRHSILNELATKIDRLHVCHPVRVAIDGRTASGKTTFADELAIFLEARQRPVIRTSIDGFHQPRAARYAGGRHSPDGYYYDARDIAAIKLLLLTPLGPNGDRKYRTASFDLDADMPITQQPKEAASDAILIVDGTFLQRPELREDWDVKIFLKASEYVAEARGLRRDIDRLGGESAVRDLYAKRYRPAYALYEHLCEPELSGDAIIDNDDLNYPQLHLREDGRLSCWHGRNSGIWLQNPPFRSAPLWTHRGIALRTAA